MSSGRSSAAAARSGPGPSGPGRPFGLSAAAMIVVRGRDRDCARRRSGPARRVRAASCRACLRLERGVRCAGPVRTVSSALACGGAGVWGCRAMSVRAMTWVWGLEELPQKETLVLLALADQANDEGLCWPRLDTLAPKSRMSVRSVKRAVAFLRRAGLVETTIRSSQEGRRGNVYRLMVGAEYCPSDLQRANLAPCGEPVDNSPVENPDMPRQDCKGPIWPLAGEGSQGARGGPLLGARGGPLLPYRDFEPSIEPPTNQAGSDPPPGPGGVDGDPSLASPPGSGRRPARTGRRGRRLSSSGSSSGAADWGLLGACLPRPMRALLTERAAARVTGLLGRARAAGWTRAEIHRVLNGNPLPDRLVNGAGLVIHRVGEIASTPAPASRRSWPAPTPSGPPVSGDGGPPLSQEDLAVVRGRIQRNPCLPEGLRASMLARLEQPGSAAAPDKDPEDAECGGREEAPSSPGVGWAGGERAS